MTQFVGLRELEPHRMRPGDARWTHRSSAPLQSRSSVLTQRLGRLSLLILAAVAFSTVGHPAPECFLLRHRERTASRCCRGAVACRRLTYSTIGVQISSIVVLLITDQLHAPKRPRVGIQCVWEHARGRGPQRARAEGEVFATAAYTHMRMPARVYLPAM